MKRAFRHIHEYYSSQNISKIRYLFMKNSEKIKLQLPGEPLMAWYNWCQDPVPGRGPVIEKHWYRECFWWQNKSQRLWPHLPDLHQCDIYMWGTLNGTVYNNSNPNTEVILKESIHLKFHAHTFHVECERCAGCDKYLQAKGKYFQQLL